MNDRLITNVSREVYRQFPELQGTRPKVQIFASDKSRTSSPIPKYLLVFNGKGETADRKKIPYSVRVIVNEQGKILKMSMSR